MSRRTHPSQSAQAQAAAASEAATMAMWESLPEGWALEGRGDVLPTEALAATFAAGNTVISEALGLVGSALTQPQSQSQLPIFATSVSARRQVPAPAPAMRATGGESFRSKASRFGVAEGVGAGQTQHVYAHASAAGRGSAVAALGHLSGRTHALRGAESLGSEGGEESVRMRLSGAAAAAGASGGGGGGSDPVYLSKLKAAVTASLNQYSSFFKVSLFGRLGHHHEGRVQAVIRAINKATKDTQIKYILEQQEALFNAVSKRPESNPALNIPSLFRKNEEHWYTKVTNLPTNPEQSGYWKAIRNALRDVEDAPGMAIKQDAWAEFHAGRAAAGGADGASVPTA